MRAACSGANGRGTVDHFGMHGRVDVQVGTLSKAIGALGGYVAGSRALIDFLYHRARPFLFSTSHPPSVAATCIAAHRRAARASRSSSSGCGTTRASSRPACGARLRHRPEREPDHAGDRRRRRAGDAAVGSAVRGRRLRAGHRLPDRGPRQGARPHDRHRHAHARRAAVRARRLRQGRPGTRRSSDGVESAERHHRDAPPSTGVCQSMDPPATAHRAHASSSTSTRRT